MSLRLEIVSQHRRALGEHGVKDFGQDGGTIGRSLETDWALPDQHRFLSGRHASIDYRSGAYYIVDTSRNGVYVNDSQTPVGRGHPQRLFPGDRIRIGEYEMTVSIDEVDDTRDVLAGLSHVDPVDLRERVEAPDPTSFDLIGEEVITGVGIELILEEDAADTVAPLDAELASDTRAGTALDPTDNPDAAERRAADLSLEIDALPESPSGSMDVLEWSRTAEAPKTERPADAVAAFCRGAGLAPPVLTAEETQALMLKIGEVMRELVAGLLTSLQLRSRQKSQLRQHGTTIQPRDNNVLKFSPNAEEALNRLLLEPSDFYLPAVQAVRSAFADTNEHHRAVVKSMQATLIDYLQQGQGQLPSDFGDRLARRYAEALQAAGAEPPRKQREAV